MRKVVFIILMIIINLSTYCEDLIFTFNDLKKDQTFEKKCWIKNPTDSKVLLVNISTSCDCIKYVCKEKVIPANDSIAVNITYVVKNPGIFYKTIDIITTNKKCNCKIIIKGKVEE